MPAPKVPMLCVKWVRIRGREKTVTKDGNRELVEQIFREAAFVRSLGIELAGCGEGWCETKLNCAPAHRQQHGFVHAGVVMTLADHTCGGAAATTVGEGLDV